LEPIRRRDWAVSWFTSVVVLPFWPYSCSKP